MHPPRSVISAPWRSGNRLLRMSVGLVATAGMARPLRPAAYGLFGCALALCDLASPLARLGLLHNTCAADWFYADTLE